MPQEPVKTPQSIRGRPPKYSKALQKEICRLLSTTGLSIREVCQRVGITEETFYAWRHKHQEFSEDVSRALEQHYAVMGESLEDYAEKDVIQGDRSDSARVQLHRTRLETRRWLLTKRLPEMYGERVAFDTSIEFEIPDLRSPQVKESEAKAKALPGPEEVRE